MLGLDLWKKKHFLATKTWNLTTMNYTKLVEKPRIFIQRFGTSSWRCYPLYDRRQGIVLSWGMTDDPMGFAHFHPPVPVTTRGRRRAMDIGQAILWGDGLDGDRVGQSPKHGGLWVQPLPNGLYKWFINGGWFLKPLFLAGMFLQEPLGPLKYSPWKRYTMGVSIKKTFFFEYYF